jgi:hypothetical protein
LSRVASRCLEATMGFEPMIRVLQDPTAAIQTLARLSPDSVQGSADSGVPGGPRPLTVFWGQATDIIDLHPSKAIIALYGKRGKV